MVKKTETVGTKPKLKKNTISVDIYVQVLFLLHSSPSIESHSEIFSFSLRNVYKSLYLFA